MQKNNLLSFSKHRILCVSRRNEVRSLDRDKRERAKKGEGCAWEQETPFCTLLSETLPHFNGSAKCVCQ